MKFVLQWTLPFAVFTTTTSAWTIVPPQSSPRQSTQLEAAPVGIIFGTSTGSTADAADLIFEALGADVADEPVDVDDLDVSDLSTLFGQYEALIVGTPTWNTGADSERSGTGWDELYGTQLAPSSPLAAVLKHKPVAVFGLGDQVSYAENYADATGELWDIFDSLGCRMLGATSQEGYEHEASKSIRGDKFCGLLLDAVNQPDLTPGRVTAWVTQLLETEGMLSGEVVNSGLDDVTHINGALPEETVVAVVEVPAELDEMADILNENIAQHSSGGFTPHLNQATGRTMWISPDGKRSFVTVKQGIASGVKP